jgi:hypothetical protein
MVSQANLTGGISSTLRFVTSNHLKIPGSALHVSSVVRSIHRLCRSDFFRRLQNLYGIFSNLEFVLFVDRALVDWSIGLESLYHIDLVEIRDFLRDREHSLGKNGVVVRQRFHVADLNV